MATVNDRNTTPGKSNLFGNLKITPITIGLGIIALCAFACFASQLFSFGGDDDDGSNDTQVEGERDLPEDADGDDSQGDDGINAPESENQEPNTSDDYDLGNVVAATGIDRDGCAVEETDTFDNDDDIYVVTEGSEIPEGTSIFVRLYKDNKAIEDLPVITADDDFGNVCINFVFESTEGFEAGTYEAEFFVNGNAADTVQFEVQ